MLLKNVVHYSCFLTSKINRWKNQLKLYSKSFCSKHDCNFRQPLGSTIYALSTPRGTSAIAVVRISGPKANQVFYAMENRKKLPQARKATLCRLHDPDTHELIDKALSLWFPSPNSFTGEDLCELHIHGGTAVIKSVLSALQKLPTFRMAEPGEFTKRAFLSGKLDLTEVEGLADLLHAETEAQQRQALRHMDGALQKLMDLWTERLKKSLANLEAYIDFSEDQHLEGSLLTSVKQEVLSLGQEISSHLQDGRKSEKLRSGVCAVIVGEPNVGKSTLLNHLCGVDAAMVSEIPGTTRDVVEASLNLDGYLLRVCDTAGIRHSSDALEQEGVRRARQMSLTADLLILVVDAQKAIQNPPPEGSTVFDLLCSSLDVHTGLDQKTVLLLNKADLLCGKDAQQAQNLAARLESTCLVSCRNGQGMGHFVNLLTKNVTEICSGHRGEEPALTHARHRTCAEQCAACLREFDLSVGSDVALGADSLRRALRHLSHVTGAVTSDDILDLIFRDFCIGK